MSYDLVKKRLCDFATTEFDHIEKEFKLNRNISFAFDSVGSLGEELTVYMFPNSIGSSSKGGCAYDNRECERDDDLNLRTIKAREVKFVCLDGTKKCKACGSKLPRFQMKCLDCDKIYLYDDFSYPCDSRAGLSAKGYKKYSVDDNIISEYIIFVCKFNEQNKYIKIFCYKIKSNNNYFKDYCLNQLSNGKDTCNLLPFSYDWNLSGIIKLFEFDIYSNNIINKFYNINNMIYEKIFYLNWNSKKRIFNRNDLSKLPDPKISELKLNGLDYLDNISYFSLRNKSHGKPRGNILRK